MPERVKALKGGILGGKGYISAPLFPELFEKGLKLVTPLKSNRRPALLPIEEKILRRKRSLIETVHGWQSQHGKREHTRHRSLISLSLSALSSFLTHGNLRNLLFPHRRPRFLIPNNNGVLYEGTNVWRDMLWDKYYTSAPEQQRKPVETYQIVKRA